MKSSRVSFLELFHPSWMQCPPNSHAYYNFEGNKAGEPSPAWWIKIAMVCLWIILRDESQTVRNSQLTLLQLDVKPTQPNPYYIQNLK